MMLAAPFFVVPYLTMGTALGQFQPYEQLGWTRRLLLSVPVAAVLMALAGRLAWSFLASSPDQRAAGTFALVFMMAALSFELIGYINVAGDRQPGRIVEVDCVGYIRGAKGSASIEVRSWHDPRRTVTLWAFFANQPDCVAGKPVRLIVHPGRLGAEWVSMAR